MTDPGDGADPAVVLPPDPRTTALAALGLLATLGLALVTEAGREPGGRLLLLPAAAVLLAAVVRDRVGGPLLRADATGLTLRPGWRPRHHAWSDVLDVTAVKDRRTRLLLVDVQVEPGPDGVRTVALSGTRLGLHPADVRDAVLARRPG